MATVTSYWHYFRLGFTAATTATSNPNPTERPARVAVLCCGVAVLENTLRRSRCAGTSKDRACSGRSTMRARHRQSYAPPPPRRKKEAVALSCTGTRHRAIALSRYPATFARATRWRQPKKRKNIKTDRKQRTTHHEKHASHILPLVTISDEPYTW